MLRVNVELLELLKKYKSKLPSVNERNDFGESLELLNNVDISLDNQSLFESLFKRSLEDKKYHVAIYIFLKFNSIPFQYYYQEMNENNTLSYFMEVVINILRGLSKFDGKHRCIKLLPELIDHINISDRKIMNNSIAMDGYQTTEFTTNICTYFYTTLCGQANDWKIDDWQNVDAKFLKYFKPNYDQALFVAMLSHNANAINHLLKSKKINVFEKTWFRTKTGENCFGTDKSLEPLSPFQAILEQAYVNKYNFTGIGYDLRIIKVFIENEPLCIKQRDRRGLDILDKMTSMKKISIEEKNGAFLDEINETLAIINNASRMLCNNNNLTLFQGAKDIDSDLSELSYDIRFKISY